MLESEVVTKLVQYLKGVEEVSWASEAALRIASGGLLTRMRDPSVDKRYAYDFGFTMMVRKKYGVIGPREINFGPIGDSTNVISLGTLGSENVGGSGFRKLGRGTIAVGVWETPRGKGIYWDRFARNNQIPVAIYEEDKRKWGPYTLHLPA